MPVVRPFRGLLYAPSLRRELGRLIAPPYDVISPARRERLAALHPGNVVHVDLPLPEGAGDPYAGAAARLRRLVADGVIERDDRASFYLCEQHYRAPSGEERTRRGVLGRLRLEPLDGGMVLPHERTLEAPRDDRRRLLAATRTHLSPVFMLHADPDGTVARLLAGAAAGETLGEARDEDGTVTRLVRIDDPDRTAGLTAALGAGWALIADGHHRYESALAYRDERRAAGHGDAEETLACLCSLRDPGLAIFPIHRLVHSLAGFDTGAFRARLETLFRVTAIGTLEALGGALGERAGREGAFGLALGGGPGGLLLEWRAGAGLDRPEMAGVPPALRRLDVILLHRLVFEGVLGITPEAQARQAHLEYVKDEGEWRARVREGRADLGVLMNPTRLDQVIEVSRQGLRLPQKSTYFHPKVPTGLAFLPLGD